MAAAVLMIPATVTMMILLLNPTACDALTSFEPLLNDTSRAGKYLVGDQDMESEFLMESHISRILVGSQKYVTDPTKNAMTAVFGGCGRPATLYASCNGRKRNNPPTGPCGVYNRGNPCLRK